MSPPVRRSRRSLLALIALAAISCGGGSGPTGGGETVVLTGSWDAVHEFSLLGEPFRTCGGQLLVESQTGGSFSGQLTIPADGGCSESGAVGTVSGTVSGSTVTFTVQGLGIDGFLQTLGCTRLSVTGFSGTASEASLIASETQTFRCTNPETGEVTQAPFVWRISAERSGT